MERGAKRLKLGHTTMAERIGAARAQLFVGREAELAEFDRFVDVDSPQALWFIVGAGGVGKSVLLQALYQRAHDKPMDAVYLDAGGIAPNPPAARHALARAGGADTFEAFCLTRERPILFIDTFESWQVLEPWFYREYLPRLPGSLKIVVCTRTSPCLEWRTDEGWRSLMQITQLTPLDDRASGEYLCRRGVAPERHAEIVAFARGIPLALAMGADSVLAGLTLQGEQADAGLIETLTESFTREAHSADQHRALQASAVVREINEPMLATMMGREQADALYAWLQKLAFMSSGERGIAPHELVREILMRDMPQRYPQRYEALAQGAFDWTVDMIEQVESLSWQKAAQLAAEAMYALRALPVVQHFLLPFGAHALYTDHARPEDQSALAAMVLAHEGPESLQWFHFWHKHCPDGLYVVRDAQCSPRGFFFKLDMEALPPDARDRDPLTRRLWQALTADFDLQPGAHAPFIRFWMSADHAQSQSPEKTQILMAVHAYNLMARNLRVTAQVFADSPEWVMQARALGIARLDGDDIPIGDRDWRIYYNDWQQESAARYYRNFARRCVAFQQALAAEQAPAQRLVTLSRSEFHAAALDALKSLQRPAQLARNPLAACALVVQHAGPDAQPAACGRLLGEQVQAVIATFGEADDNGRRWQRVLHRAYIAPAHSHKEAAALLNMGYSTFRRQLGEAREVLIEELWQEELKAR